MMSPIIPEKDRGLSVNEIISKYRTQIDDVCKVDNDTRDTFELFIDNFIKYLKEE